MLVASATTRFEGLDDPRAPFFELFRLVHLPPLTTEECRRLWDVVTGQAPQTHQIRPLEILTGGSPRLLVVVAAFARHRSLRQLMEELVGLIDEHTEYFRGHLESLPKNERRVFVSLIDLWQASSTGEIAARARLDVRVVSTMLGRLVDRGAVTVVPAADGAKRLYAASVGLYSIYYKLRRERDEAAVVEALIHFMVAFYDVGELYHVSDQLFQDAIDSTAVQRGIDRALLRRAASLDDPPSRMKWEKVERTSDKVRDRRRVDAMVRLQDDVQAAYRKEDWKRVLEIAERYVADGWVEAASGWEREHEWAHVQHLRSDAHLRLKHFREVIAIGDEVAERYGDTRDATLLYRLSSMALNKAGAHYQLGDCAAARSESRDVIDRFGKYGSPWHDVQVAAALVVQAEADNELGNAGSSIALLDEVQERFGGSDDVDVQWSVARSLIAKGEVVGRHLNDHRRSAEIFSEAVERFGRSEHPEIRRSVRSARMNRAFQYGASGDFEKELASYDDVIALPAGSETSPRERWPVLIALMYKGRRLAELGRAEQALATCNEAAQRFDEDMAEWPNETLRWMDWHVQGTRALALMRSGKTAAAIDAFRSAYALFLPRHEIAMGEMLRLVPELIAAGAPEGDLIAVLVGDDRRSTALQPIIVALRQRTGESVRAPVEVLEVAADLRKRIETRLAAGVMPGFMYPLGRD